MVLTGTFGFGQWLLSRRRDWSLSITGFLALALIVSTPVPGFAQSAIAGVVRDTSNAVLPGVTVEAASPALIEKVRTAVTDGSGRYQLVDLRPGVYSVTFTLPGFQTVVRGNLTLPASFSATVNAELTVAGVQETVTVTSESPVVDVQSTEATIAFSKELMDAIPTNRMPTSYATFMPSVVTDVGTATPSGPAINGLTAHGSNSFESLMEIDGFDIRNMNNSGGGAFYYYPNQAMSQEVTVTVGSAGADSQMASVTTNVIPREGSNQFTASMALTFTNADLASNNITPALEAQGISKGNIEKQWDYNPSGGGPIIRDKLWFYAAYRYLGFDYNATGSYYNTDPSAWTYVPDLSRPAVGIQDDIGKALRLTWQASPKNKISAFFDHAPFTHYFRGFGATRSPEATTYSPIGPYTDLPLSMMSVSWKSPVTNRLLLEAGFARLDGALPLGRQNDPELFKGPHPWNPNQVSARELTTGVVFRASDRYGEFGSSLSYRIRTALNYVTGSHAFKIGFNDNTGERRQRDVRNGGYNVSLRNSAPTSLTLFAPTDLRQKVNADIGIYAQDQWTLGRATLNLGLRFDYMKAGRPGVTVRGNRDVFPGSAYQGVADIVDPGGEVVNWKDLSPRIGGSYDLFGTGKTALKGFIGKYVQGQSTQLVQASDPQALAILSANRSWNDNGDFLPDCDFSNPDINGECGALSNRNFGLGNPNALTFDPSGMKGFGVRGYTWELSASVQQEVVPGLSVDVGYFRKWAGNFFTEPGNIAVASAYQDNLLIGPQNFSPFCLTVPTDSRLPGGGGNDLCGFYDINPDKFGVSKEVATYATNFGEMSRTYNGLDVNVNGRLPGGVRFMGGLGTGATRVEQCFVIDNPGTYLTPLDPFGSWTQQFCDRHPPFQTQFKGTVILPLPRDVQVTAVYLDTPGPDLSGTSYVATNAEVAPSLGRSLAGGARTITLPLMAEGTLYGERIRRADVRLSKVLRIGRLRVAPALDIFNLLNSSTATDYNLRYGPDWLNATGIQDPRIFRISAQADFEF